MLPQKPYHKDISRPNWTQSAGRDEHVLWLDKNENIDPIYNQQMMSVVHAMQPQAIFAYPDCSPVYHKLAKSIGVAANNLIFAAGSDGIIRLAYEAFIQPGDKVLYPTPTFAMYAVYAQIYGAQVLTVDYQPSVNGPWLDTNRYLELIRTEKPKLVCLPNADSPTGSVISQKILSDIIKTAKSVGAVVLIDEAYYPFFNETVLPWIHEEDNLLVARTFSKAWGLAGIRVGFAAGNVELITQLHRLRPMYEIGNFSLSVVDRALDHREAMEASVARILEGKQYFMETLQRLGFDVIPHTQGNFMHVAFGEYANQIHAALESKVLYRKNFGHPSLAGYSRFTATTKQHFSRVLQLISQAMSDSTVNLQVEVTP